MLSGISDELIGRCHEPAENLRSCSTRVGVQRDQHARLTVLFFFAIFSLYQAIGEDKQQVARRQSNLAKFVTGVAQQAERQATGFEPLNCA